MDQCLIPVIELITRVNVQVSSNYTYHNICSVYVCVQADMSLLTEEAHSAIRCFVDSLPLPVKQQTFQPILFDFRIWSKCQFSVCIGQFCVYLSAVFGRKNCLTSVQSNLANWLFALNPLIFAMGDADPIKYKFLRPPGVSTPNRMSICSAIVLIVYI